MTRLAQEIECLQKDPSTSFWLKNRLKELEWRDCLDMARDAALFAGIAMRRLEEIMDGGEEDDATD